MERVNSSVFIFEKRCFINETHGLCIRTCHWLTREAIQVCGQPGFGKVFLRRADDDYRVDIFSISSLMTLIVPVKKELIVLTNEPWLCDKVECLAKFINEFSLQAMPDFSNQEFSEILRKIKSGH